MDKYSGKGINNMVSDTEGMETRATKALKNYKVWEIKELRVNYRIALALSALLHGTWSRETVIWGDAKYNLNSVILG